MILDNSMVHFHPSLYHFMEKNKKKELEQCEEAWNKKIAGELMKRRIKKICEGSYFKCKKTTHHLDNCGDDKENREMKKESEKK
jgi:hypothetical protein